MVLVSSPWDHVQLQVESKRLIPRTGDSSIRPSSELSRPESLASCSAGPSPLRTATGAGSASPEPASGESAGAPGGRPPPSAWLTGQGHRALTCPSPPQFQQRRPVRPFGSLCSADWAEVPEGDSGCGGRAPAGARAAKGLPLAGSAPYAASAVPPAAWFAVIMGFIPGQPGTRHALQRGFLCCFPQIGHIHEYIFNGAAFMPSGATLHPFSAHPGVQ